MEESRIQSLFSVTEIEILYRNKVKTAERPRVTSPSEAYTVLMQAWDMNKIELVEQFNILLLDRNNRCLGFSNIATGGVSDCRVDPKIVFATALKARASGIIAAHNHPSGNTDPSDADILLTQKLSNGGKLLDIVVIDHLIVNPYSYSSLAEASLHI
jgi:DNA repair protein RadC